MKATAKKIVLCMVLCALMAGTNSCRKDKTEEESAEQMAPVFDDSDEIIVSEEGDDEEEPAAYRDHLASPEPDYSSDNDEGFRDDYSNDDYNDDASYEDDTDDGDYSKKGSLRKKAKEVYKAGKNKVKEKTRDWKEEHADQIDEAKEKGRNLKNKTKQKIGGWLERAREKLSD